MKPRICNKVVKLILDIGNGLNVVKVMPESAIKFGAYEVGRYLSSVYAS